MSPFRVLMAVCAGVLLCGSAVELATPVPEWAHFALRNLSLVVSFSYIRDLYRSGALGFNVPLNVSVLRAPVNNLAVVAVTAHIIAGIWGP